MELGVHSAKCFYEICMYILLKYIYNFSVVSKENASS